MNRLSSISRIAIVLVFLFNLSGCFPKLISIYVTPPSTNMIVGEDDEFYVIGVFSDGSEKPLVNATWSFSGDGGFISPSTGSRTVFTATKAGTGQVWAYNDTRTFSASARVTIQEIVQSVLTRIEVSPSAKTLVEGSITLFSAKGFDQHGEEYQIIPSWSVIGEIGTVSPVTGITTAFSAGNVDEVTKGVVRASVGSVFGDAEVTVKKEDPYLERIVISPADWSMLEGTQKNFTAQGYDQYGNTYAIIPSWSTTGDIGSVSPTTGISTLFTAANVTTDIRGTLIASVDSIFGVSEIVVRDFSAPVLTSIEISPSPWSMEVGDTKEFTATGYDQYGDPIALTSHPTWSVTGGLGVLATPYNLDVTTLCATTIGSGSLKATVGLLESTVDVNVISTTSNLTDVAASANGGVATAGSTGTYMSITHFPYMGNDGLFTTEWCNSFLLPDWYKITFNDTYLIEEVRCISRYNTHTYDIQLSQDGVNWTTIATHVTHNRVVAGQDEGIDDYRVAITPQPARYIKVVINSSDAPSGYIFKAILTEVQAFSDL